MTLTEWARKHPPLSEPLDLSRYRRTDLYAGTGPTRRLVRQNVLVYGDKNRLVPPTEEALVQLAGKAP